MVKNKAKRSNPSAQPLRRRSEIRERLGISPRRFFRFPQAKGKTVEEVQFSTDSEYHCITVKFEDRTSLSFRIETGFTVVADYSDWKTGNQRLLRRWGPMRSGH